MALSTSSITFDFLYLMSPAKRAATFDANSFLIIFSPFSGGLWAAIFISILCIILGVLSAEYIQSDFSLSVKSVITRIRLQFNPVERVGQQLEHKLGEHR